MMYALRDRIIDLTNSLRLHQFECAMFHARRVSVYTSEIVQAALIFLHNFIDQRYSIVNIQFIQFVTRN
jgi:hypothetical protein